MLAAWLRCFQIETRPPHSDESVNFLFTETTNRLGYYPYSHENYHGPIYFYLITLLVNTFGDSLLALRLGSIICGTLIVFAGSGFAGLAGWPFAIIAALLLAISPSMIFFSRYAIHEPLLVLATMTLAISTFRWAENRRPLQIYFAALSIAVMILTKETFGVAVFCVLLAALTLKSFRSARPAFMEQSGAAFGASLLCIFLIIFTFTAGFRWPDGIGEMFLALPQWFGRGSSDVGHIKRVEYYAKDVIWLTEPQLLLFPAAAMLLAIMPFRGEHRTTRFHLFFAVWMVSALAVYSLIPYKTVWLVINLTLPAILLGASVIADMLTRDSIPVRILGAAVLLVTVLSSAKQTLKYNFVELPLPGAHVAVNEAIPFGPGNPFSYVHTSPGTLELVKDVRSYWEKKPNASVLVGVDGYFPLPYYFRKEVNRCAYTKVTDIADAATRYDIMVLDYTTTWSDPNWTKNYYRLSDYSESNTYFKKLKD